VLLACQELDGALELTETAPTYLRETRGGRNVRHARQIVFQLAEVAVPRELLVAILVRISRLSPAPG